MALRVLSVKEVLARTSFSRKTIYRLMDAGKFPRQVQLSAHRVGWLEDEVDAWIRARIQLVPAIGQGREVA